MIWWRQSIAWVSFMSVYAIVATHWSSYQGSRAEEAVKNGQEDNSCGEMPEDCGELP